MTHLKTLLHLILLITFLGFEGFSQATNLDSVETKWIRNNPVINYSGDPDWAPFDFNEAGKQSGISKNFIDEIAKETGLKFNYIPAKSWTDIRNLLRNGQVQMISAIASSKSREEYFEFSEPYLHSEFVILSNEKEKRIMDEFDLKGLKVGLVKDYQVSNEMEKMHKNLDYRYFTSIPELLNALKEDQIQACIMEFTVAVYFIERLALTEVRIIPSSLKDQTIHFGVLKDLSPLIGIINKVLQGIENEKRMDLKKDFFEIGLNKGIQKKYIRLISVGLLFLGIIAIVFVFWNQGLKKEIKRRKDMEAKLTLLNVELRGQKEKLDQALNKLKDSQADLVRSRNLSVIAQFSATVNHEVSNLLNYLMGSLNPLKRDFDYIRSKLDSEIKDAELKTTEEEIEQLLDNLDKGSRQALEILNGLRDFGKEDPNKFIPQNINESIQSVIKLLTPSLPKNIRIELELTNIPSVMAIPGPLKQMFINLAQNAIQAMPAGGELIIRSFQNSEGQVFVEFKDNGLGIPEKDLDKIFEPFFSTKRESGTGLGLNIVKGIMEEHKGSVNVNSEQEKGSSFTLSFPSS